MENKLIEWVKKEKNRLGLSLREMSENSNSIISHAHISDTLKYKQAISEKFVLAMAIAFNMPIWEAFYMAGMLPDEHKSVAELLIKYEKLPPDGKKDVLDQIDFLMFKHKIEV